MKPITNVELNAGGGMIALSCEYDGARYHLWLSERTLKPKDDVLYKNPLLNQPNEFSTRKISQTRGVGLIIVPVMMAQVEALIPGLRAKIKYEEDEQMAYNEDYQRDEAVKAAAKDLLAACRAQQEFIRRMVSEGFIDGSDLQECGSTQALSGAAIARAESWRSNG
jgi:hypothetical protein